MISDLTMCQKLCSTSEIWGITTLPCEFTTTWGNIVIAVSIDIAIAVSIAIAIAIVIVIAIAIVISIVIIIAVAITISIEILVAIYIFIKIYIAIANTIDVGVSSDMGFHLWLKGMDKLLKFLDLSSEVIFGRVDIFNCFAVRGDSSCQLIEGLSGLLLHDDIVNVESNLFCINLGVSYILVCLIEEDEEVNPEIFCC